VTEKLDKWLNCDKLKKTSSRPFAEGSLAEVAEYYD
jgi:hypothetical protein